VNAYTPDVVSAISKIVTAIEKGLVKVSIVTVRDISIMVKISISIYKCEN